MPRDLYAKTNKYFASGQHQEEQPEPGIPSNLAAGFLQTNIKEPLEGMMNTIANAPTRTAQLGRAFQDPKILLANLMQKKEYIPEFNPHEMLGTNPNAPITSSAGAAQMIGSLAPALPIGGAGAFPEISELAGNAKQVATKGIDKVKDLAKALPSPAKKAAEFHAQMGNVPSDVNTQRVANTIKTSHDIQLADALRDKQKVMDVADGNNIYGEAEKSGNKYLANEHRMNAYNETLQNAHHNFVKDTNFVNADNLRSEFKSQIRDIYSDLKARNITREESKQKLAPLEDGLKDLDHDMNSYIDTLPAEVKPLWKSWNNKYAKNVTPYYKDKAIREITKPRTKTEQTEGLRSSTVKSLFSYPKSHIKTILSHFPQEGKDYIIYNELSGIDPNDAGALYKKLSELKQSKGYSEYFTPKLNTFMDGLKKDIAYKEKLQAGAAFATALGFHHPGLAALIALRKELGPVIEILKGIKH